MKPVAVYVHIPFCPSKCGYCDFNSYAMTGDIVPRTVAAIIAEIKLSPLSGRPAKTIFFGGGTPTFLDAEQQVAILEAIKDVHPPVEGCEITTEANPGTVDAEKFAALRQAGFNRLSIGAQSFDSGELKVLDRVHSPGDVVQAVSAAREAGFANLSLDLMFALPHQGMARWRANLEQALQLTPDHLSLYCLTVEPATRFYKLFLQGRLHQPDDETQAKMYDHTVKRVREAGFDRYEISNFAKPGKECAHNLCYWRGEEYAGYGPGAVARIANVRTTNMKHPERYCEAVSSLAASAGSPSDSKPIAPLTSAGFASDSISAVLNTATPLHCESETLDDASLRTERIMLGLRLREGIPAREFDPVALEGVRAKGWISVDENVHLTDVGAHYCNQVILDLL